MVYKLIVFPQAQEDIEYAAFWYELHKNGLGSDFILALDAELNQLSRNPLLNSKIHKDFRRAIINRFPYSVFYIVINKQILVLAILHQSRNPKVLKKIKP